MKIRVDNPAVLPDLMAELLRRLDAVVSQTAENELEVSLLGSRSEQANAEELRERIRAWGRGGARLMEVAPSDGSGGTPPPGANRPHRLL